MYALVLLLEPDSGGQIQQIADTFGVDWPHLIAQIISFSIVCIVLQRFAYKPVLKMLDQRRQQIADGQAEREKIKSELAQAETKCHEIILQANAQAKSLIDEARKSAARLQQQETQRAIAAAEQIIIKARQAAAQEHARMLTELKREVGQLVIQTAATAMGRVLTMEDQRRMVAETSERLATVAS
jgi:F-type H+-transporting ATPase subunit b